MTDQLRLLHKVFQAPISVNYGLTERTNISFATPSPNWELPFRFNSLYGITENRSAAAGAEIVGTSLWNDVTPLIRYCTKDFGSVDDEGKCVKILGRSQEFLIDKAGARIPGLSIVIDEITWDFVRLYQVRQRRLGHIEIALVARDPGGLTPEQKTFVREAQEKRWGTFFEVAVVEVDDIPLSANGKRKLVVAESQSQEF